MEQTKYGTNKSCAPHYEFFNGNKIYTGSTIRNWYKVKTWLENPKFADCKPQFQIVHWSNKYLLGYDSGIYLFTLQITMYLLCRICKEILNWCLVIIYRYYQKTCVSVSTMKLEIQYLHFLKKVKNSSTYTPTDISWNERLS